MAESRFLSPDECAELLRLNTLPGDARERLRNLMRRQGLPSLRRGRLILFDRQRVLAWLGAEPEGTGGTNKTTHPARLQTKSQGRQRVMESSSLDLTQNTPNASAVRQTTAPKRARGAQPGNANAQKSGARSRHIRLGKLPRGMGHGGKALGRLRRVLEDETLARKGKISTTSEMTILAVQVHAARRLLLSRYLAREGESLSLQDRLALTAAIAQSADATVRALKQLDLDVSQQQTLIEALYGPRHPPTIYDAHTKPASAPSRDAAAANAQGAADVGDAPGAA